MIKCFNVSKEYKEDGYSLAVNNVSFQINDGEFVALTGKSGSGKSTLLNMFGLIDSATSGLIEVNGVDVNKLSSNEKAKFRNKEIGYIFQSFYLEPSYSVFKNVELPLLISNMEVKKRKQRVEECLYQVDMLHKKYANTCDLSGGEKQRICIARAIANEPKLILADEPCGNLDSENTENIMRLLLNLNKNNTTIILVTHSAEEAQRANRIIQLKDGEIVSDEINKLFKNINE